MPDYKYKNLSEERWFNLSFFEQMANIGADICRAINWLKKGDKKYSESALKRALELLYLTIKDEKNKPHLKELTRLREIILDYFYCNNTYNSDEDFFHKYFYYFNYAARKTV